MYAVCIDVYFKYIYNNRIISLQLKYKLYICVLAYYVVYTLAPGSIICSVIVMFCEPVLFYY